jgi:hypothetical protein
MDSVACLVFHAQLNPHPFRQSQRFDRAERTLAENGLNMPHHSSNDTNPSRPTRNKITPAPHPPASKHVNQDFQPQTTQMKD